MILRTLGPLRPELASALAAAGIETSTAGPYDAVFARDRPLRARNRALGKAVVVDASSGYLARARLGRRLALRAASLVVAPSETEAEALSTARLGPKRVVSCFTGTEESIFHPPWRAAVPFTCLLVGSAGLDTVLAAARLRVELQFRVLGAPAELPDRPPNVEHLRRIERGLVPHEVRRAGCVLAFARYGIPPEAFAALACGTPLVAPDTAAVRELVTDGESALLVPQDDPEALAAAARRLDADFELARRLSERGLAAYLERAGEEILARRWADLLARI